MDLKTGVAELNTGVLNKELQFIHALDLNEPVSAVQLADDAIDLMVARDRSKVLESKIGRLNRRQNSGQNNAGVQRSRLPLLTTRNISVEFGFRTGGKTGLAFEKVRLRVCLEIEFADLGGRARVVGLRGSLPLPAARRPHRRIDKKHFLLGAYPADAAARSFPRQDIVSIAWRSLGATPRCKRPKLLFVIFSSIVLVTHSDD